VVHIYWEENPPHHHPLAIRDNRWCTPSNTNGLYDICGPLGLLHHNGSNPSEPTSGSNPVDSRAYFQHLFPSAPVFTCASMRAHTPTLDGQGQDRVFGRRRPNLAGALAVASRGVTTRGSFLPREREHCYTLMHANALACTLTRFLDGAVRFNRASVPYPLSPLCRALASSLPGWEAKPRPPFYLPLGSPEACSHV
jgi:hypothetical protein